MPMRCWACSTMGGSMLDVCKVCNSRITGSEQLSCSDMLQQQVAALENPAKEQNSILSMLLSQLLYTIVAAAHDVQQCNMPAGLGAINCWCSTTSKHWPLTGAWAPSMLGTRQQGTP